MTRTTRAGRLRTGIAVVGVAATVPYLVLKTLWLTGHPVGVDDPAQLDDLRLVNLLTVGMDAVSVLLSLTFVRPWGLRVRAGWPAFPMWVGTGLLGTILVALPLFLLSLAVLGPPAPDPDQDAPAGWVFPLVYGGFAVQGTALIAGFLLYAPERWPWLRHARIGDLPGSATLGVQRALAGAAVVPALGVAAAHGYWLCGGTAGLPTDWTSQSNRGVAVMDGVTAVMALAAAGALLVLVWRRFPRRGLRVPLAAAWTASGSLFGWGAWQLVAHGTTTAVTDAGRALPGLLVVVQSLQVVTGLLVFVVGAFALAERAAPAAPRGGPGARPDVESAA
ncbi:hypothetical protein ACWGB8_32000 [Kitasatospora sp. NPDC054939]